MTPGQVSAEPRFPHEISNLE